jgi:hypothetical protein
LYCTEIDGLPKPIAVHKTQLDWDEKITWEDTEGKDNDPSFYSWLPETGAFNTINLDDTILSELADSTTLSLRFTTPRTNKIKGDTTAKFASRLYPDKNKRPVLILELGDSDLKE